MRNALWLVQRLGMIRRNRRTPTGQYRSAMGHHLQTHLSFALAVSQGNVTSAFRACADRISAMKVTYLLHSKSQCNLSTRWQYAKLELGELRSQSDARFPSSLPGI